MKFDSTGRLSLESKRIVQTVKSQNKFEIERLRKEYLGELKIPRSQFRKDRNITVLQEGPSYHLLCVYFLLDLIDYYWDGQEFIERYGQAEIFLLHELSVSEKGELQEIPGLSQKVSRINEFIKKPMLFFFLPYYYDKDFVVNEAFPGTLVILYASNEKTTEIIMYEALAHHYYQDILEGELPKWATSYSHFLEELIEWCNGKDSMFRYET